MPVPGTLNVSLSIVVRAETVCYIVIYDIAQRAATGQGRKEEWSHERYHQPPITRTDQELLKRSPHRRNLVQSRFPAS